MGQRVDRKIIVRLTTGVACLAIGWATAGTAQAAETDPKTDEIIVTARKREENLLDVPVSLMQGKHRTDLQSRMLDSGDLKPVRYERVNAGTPWLGQGRPAAPGQLP